MVVLLESLLFPNAPEFTQVAKGRISRFLVDSAFVTLSQRKKGTRRAKTLAIRGLRTIAVPEIVTIDNDADPCEDFRTQQTFRKPGPTNATFESRNANVYHIPCGSRDALHRFGQTVPGLRLVDSGRCDGGCTRRFKRRAGNRSFRASATVARDCPTSKHHGQRKRKKTPKLRGKISLSTLVVNSKISSSRHSLT